MTVKTDKYSPREISQLHIPFTTDISYIRDDCNKMASGLSIKVSTACSNPNVDAKP